MIRIFYLSRINLLSGRTNVYNLAKTCETLDAQDNFSVKLITTDQPNNQEIFWQRMGISRPFKLICLGSTNTDSKLNNGRKWYEFWLMFRANLSLIIFIFGQRREFEAVYYRDETLLPAIFFAKKILNKKAFFEIHSVLERPWRQRLNDWGIRIVDGVIAISSGLKQYYLKLNQQILVSLCSAAEESWFDHSLTKKELRIHLKLPPEPYLLCYTGVVGANPNNDYYEIDDVIRGLVNLPLNICFVVVGEINNNATWLRRLANELAVADRLIIVPWQERGEIPKYLQAADALVIPKRKKDRIGDSPAKIFPALASGRPIIAGRAECITEILTDKTDSLIVETNNPLGWEKAIKQVYENEDFACQIAKRALETKKQYTWEKRGQAIGSFINQVFAC